MADAVRSSAIRGADCEPIDATTTLNAASPGGKPLREV
jgi:hypothetical protein